MMFVVHGTLIGSADPKISWLISRIEDASKMARVTSFYTSLVDSDVRKRTGEETKPALAVQVISSDEELAEKLREDLREYIALAGYTIAVF